jgi:chromosome segregation ATPase
MLSDALSTLRAVETRAARVRTGVEPLVERLERLTRERQQMREQRTDDGRLERNRLEIVEAQWSFCTR